MKQIVIEIKEDGSTSLDVAGVKGQGCKALTAQLEQALGKTLKSTAKPEMFQKESQGAQQSPGHHRS